MLPLYRSIRWKLIEDLLREGHGCILEEHADDVADISALIHQVRQQFPQIPIRMLAVFTGPERLAVRLSEEGIDLNTPDADYARQSIKGFARALPAVLPLFDESIVLLGEGRRPFCPQIAAHYVSSNFLLEERQFDLAAMQKLAAHLGFMALPEMLRPHSLVCPDSMLRSVSHREIERVNPSKSWTDIPPDADFWAAVKAEMKDGGS